MDAKKVRTLYFLWANLFFLSGCLFLLQYAGLMSAPDFVSPGALLVMAVVLFVNAVFQLLRSMRGGKE